MAKTKKIVKKVKTPEIKPTTLSVSEVLDLEELNHNLAILKQQTKEHKLIIDKVSLKKKMFEQEIIIQTQNVSDAERQLREHGEKVIRKEEALKKVRDRLCEKYDVKQIAYNQDTLELVKES